MPNQDESATDGNTLPPSVDGRLFHSRRWRHVAMFALCLAAAAAITWVASRFTVPADRDTAISTAADAPVSTSSTLPATRPPTVSLPASSLPGTAEQLQQEAQRVAGDLRARFPRLPEALHVAAMTHAQFHQTAEAEKLWRQCLELSPAHPQFSVNLATVVMERGDSEEAAAVLRKAVAAGNPSPDVLYNLGVALTDLGRCEEAEGVVQQALAANPQLAAHWVVLGQAQLKLGKVADAESSLTKALELGAQSPALYFALSNACTRQGKQDEAARHRARFTEMSAAQPLNPQQRFQILSAVEARRTTVAILAEAAAVHAWQEDSLEAERLLLRGLALDPASVVSCRGLVNLYRDAGMHAEERVALRRLVEVQPSNYANYLELAQVCGELAEPESAEAALKLAIAVRPDAAEAFTMLAQYHLEGGRPEKARWFAQEAVRRRATAEGWTLLAATCRLLGDQASADAALERARQLESNRPQQPTPSGNTEKGPEGQ